ncbi:coproporphyrinogen-III oxidase family protein [Aureibacter tunicatorum]|uniref:Oxygen-independent coproporphyrinogen-3 oxidase n=1 Tax=Aureibacter tunicatorum TaxID=866807 RepID=A0AAE3XJY7_9BACT|nr:radical SAM protein [Aureibacter tunicatorum]MDR6238023.1 oxygen-independent coproporphyrinogen-3 oxidase [Aureibacter tunicatorum]BDD03056.1 hypothetical protein AUTU_05390 [Aureibacter tunicatorum]
MMTKKDKHHSKEASSNHSHGMKAKATLDGLLSLLSQSPDKDRERAVYFHTPFCASRCTYCPFYKYTTLKSKGYDKHVIEMNNMLGKMPYIKEQPFEIFFFGGGTPTLLDDSSMKKVLTSFNENYAFADDYEFTVESTVRHLTDSKISLLKAHGVNRISLGIQAFDIKTRRMLGRPSSEELICEVVKKVQDSGMKLSIDLMYGLPGQTTTHFEEQVGKAIDFEPDNISMYRLQLIGDLPIAKMIQKGKLPNLPDKSFIARMQSAGIDVAASQGYTQWNIKNFSREKNAPCRYTQKTIKDRDLIPVGSSAGGKIGDYRLFSQVDYTIFSETLQNGILPYLHCMEKPRTVSETILGILEGMKIDKTALDYFLKSEAVNKSFERLLLEGWLKTFESGMKLTKKGVLEFEQLKHFFE